MKGNQVDHSQFTPTIVIEIERMKQIRLESVLKKTTAMSNKVKLSGKEKDQSKE